MFAGSAGGWKCRGNAGRKELRDALKASPPALLSPDLHTLLSERCHNNPGTAPGLPGAPEPRNPPEPRQAGLALPGLCSYK